MTWLTGHNRGRAIDWRKNLHVAQLKFFFVFCLVEYGHSLLGTVCTIVPTIRMQNYILP